MGATVQEEFKDMQINKGDINLVTGEKSDDGGYEAQTYAATMTLQNKGKYQNQKQFLLT